MKRFCYEPSLSILHGLVKPGDVVLDIGANFGVYSLALSSRVGREGMVHAFEPGAEALGQLHRNCDELNPALNVTIWPIALSDRQGQASLHHIGGAPTTFSLGGSADSDAEPIELATLDDWARTQSIDRVSVIKMDIEGHELSAFVGGSGTIRRFRPVIMFEVSAAALARSDASAMQLMELVRSLGYSLYRLSNGFFVEADDLRDANYFAFPAETGR